MADPLGLHLSALSLSRSVSPFGTVSSTATAGSTNDLQLKWMQAMHQTLVNGIPRVDFEGAIAAGKTSSLRSFEHYLRKKHPGLADLVAAFPEPVEQWIETGILGDYYTNIDRYAAVFQFFVHFTQMRQRVGGVQSGARLVIFERSPLISWEVFVKGLLSRMAVSEANAIRFMYSHLHDTTPAPSLIYPNMYVLVNTPIEICEHRALMRGREAETHNKDKLEDSFIDIMRTTREAHFRALGSTDGYAAILNTNNLVRLTTPGDYDPRKFFDGVAPAIESFPEVLENALNDSGLCWDDVRCVVPVLVLDNSVDRQHNPHEYEDHMIKPLMAAISFLLNEAH